MSWTETIDGCGCCGCCGTLAISNLGYYSSDPGPSLYFQGGDHWSWFYSAGQGVREETGVQCRVRLSGIPDTIPKAGPQPDYIEAEVIADVTMLIDCGYVTLKAGEKVYFDRKAGGTLEYQLRERPIVCGGD